MNRMFKWCSLALLFTLLNVGHPVMAQNDNGKDKTEKKDKDKDGDGNNNEGFNWGLLGLLGLLGLAGLRKTESKPVPVERAASVPRSDSPMT